MTSSISSAASDVAHDLKAAETKNGQPTWASNAEEHTNIIPHIPNYWTPSYEKNTIISTSEYYQASNENSFCFSTDELD